MLPPRVDVIVIGAGPAGSVACSLLASKGFQVLCLEQSWFPRMVVGESLLPRCNSLLEQAGLWDTVSSRNYMKKYGALFLRGNQRERFAAQDGLPGDPGYTFQVPRDDFDQTLASQARKQGALFAFGNKVQAFTSNPDTIGVQILNLESKQTSEVTAQFLLDCSGQARVLPRLLELEQTAGKQGNTAWFTHIEGDDRPTGEEQGDTWICIHDSGAWLWVIPFSNGRTSIGAVCNPAVLGHDADQSNLLKTLWSSEPNLAHRLRNAEQVQPIRRLEQWSHKVTTKVGHRWAIVGDAGEFLDPIFSSGVCLAMESAQRACDLVGLQLEGGQPDWEQHYHQPLTKATEVFKQLVHSWYQRDLEQIFFADKKLPSIKQCLTSVLAGHVFNEENPLVSQTEKMLKRLTYAVKANP
jgi:flavin-dependent dehydrogenase